MSCDRGPTSSKLVEVGFMPFEDVDSVAHDEYIVSTVCNALERASIGSYGLAIVLPFADTIADDSGQFLYGRSVWTRSWHRGSCLPKGHTEQYEYRGNTCHGFQCSHLSSPFVGISFLSLTLRLSRAPCQECRV